MKGHVTQSRAAQAHLLQKECGIQCRLEKGWVGEQHTISERCDDSGLIFGVMNAYVCEDRDMGILTRKAEVDARAAFNPKYIAPPT